MNSKTTVPIIVAIIGGIALIIAATATGVFGLIGKSDKPVPKSQTYTGRIVNSKSGSPIQGAQVSLEITGVPDLKYTDSSGIYRFVLRETRSDTEAKVRVEAANYQLFERYVRVLPNSELEEIRLIPNSELPPPPPPIQEWPKELKASTGKPGSTAEWEIIVPPGAINDHDCNFIVKGATSVTYEGKLKEEMPGGEFYLDIRLGKTAELVSASGKYRITLTNEPLMHYAKGALGTGWLTPPNEDFVFSVDKLK